MTAASARESFCTAFRMLGRVDVEAMAMAQSPGRMVSANTKWPDHGMVPATSPMLLVSLSSAG
eukprot:11219916-Lingulodinium_polyedra.AAC.1